MTMGGGAQAPPSGQGRGKHELPLCLVTQLPQRLRRWGPSLRPAGRPAEGPTGERRGARATHPGGEAMVSSFPHKSLTTAVLPLPRVGGGGGAASPLLGYFLL
ncbi:hypothetical protein Scep_025830 [Stephania cephalantha]|uniref:Uncharacterized protein n=1 Tax=Stephania cephalantha TaxID=152367 RepID=A0AAP0EIZ8_9MAGN